MAIKRNFILSTGIGVSANNLYLVSTTPSTSTTTGALIVSGGAGIGGTLFTSSSNISSVSGVLLNNGNVTGSLTGTATTSTNIQINSAGSTNSTHSLVITPNASSSGSAISTDSTLFFNPSTEILSVSGVAITSSTASTSTSTGALIVTGGAGIGGSLNVATSIAVNSGVNGLTLQKASGASFGAIYSTSVTPSTSNYSLATDGTNLNLNSTNNLYLNISNTTKLTLSTNNLSVGINVASTSTSTGALTVTGGVGIGGSIYGGSTISAADNIEVKSAKEVRFNNSGNTYYTGLKAGSNASNTTYTLPIAFPGTGTSILQSDTSGTLTWVAMTASGSATTANSINITSAASNSSHPVLFSPSTSNVVGSAVSSDASLFYNPSTKILSVSGLAITAGTASTSTFTGALLVTGGVGISGQVSFTRASLGFTGVTGTPTMAFIGATTSSYISLNVLSDNSLSWEGSSGQLFSIDNNLSSGEIFAVSDISGLPIISASAGQTVSINEFGGYTKIGNGSISSTGGSSVAADGTLVVYGGVGITGNANIGGTVRINNTTNSANTGSGGLVVTGGAGIGQSVSIGGRLQLFNGSNYTAFISSASGNTAYTFPATSPATGSSVLQSTSAGVMSWIPLATPTGSTDGIVQFKSGSSFGGTLSFFFDTNLLSLRVSGFPGGNVTSSADAVLKLETTVGSFNGNTNGTYVAVNAPSGFTGDLVNLQVNASSKFRIDYTGAIIQLAGTNASSTTTGTLQVRGGVGVTGNTYVGGTIYTGTGTFSKNLSPGDIGLDNGTVDTPAVLYYWANNKNIGTDVYYAGSGTTRFRVVKELNESGGAELWSVDRNGIVTQTAWDVGEVIASRMYNYSDLNMSATTTINSTTYTNVATITYTPKSTTSYLWLEFDANYDYSSGTTADDFFSRITVAGSVIVEKNQIMIGQIGGGTRSGTIFPISGRYTNSTTSGIAITVQAKWGSADDAIRVYGSSTSGYMRIMEIGR
jgi:hypothetical protein